MSALAVREARLAAGAWRKENRKGAYVEDCAPCAACKGVAAEAGSGGDVCGACGGGGVVEAPIPPLAADEASFLGDLRIWQLGWAAYREVVGEPEAAFVEWAGQYEREVEREYERRVSEE